MGLVQMGHGRRRDLPALSQLRRRPRLCGKDARLCPASCGTGSGAGAEQGHFAAALAHNPVPSPATARSGDGRAQADRDDLGHGRRADAADRRHQLCEPGDGARRTSRAGSRHAQGAGRGPAHADPAVPGRGDRHGGGGDVVGYDPGGDRPAHGQRGRRAVAELPLCAGPAGAGRAGAGDRGAGGFLSGGGPVPLPDVRGAGLRPRAGRWTGWRTAA